MNNSKLPVKLVYCAAVLLFLAGCGAVEKIENIAIDPIEASTVQDGRYRAAVRYFPVTAKVEVSVEDGMMTGIKLIRHFHGPDHGADAIIPEVIGRQSLQVDAIAGATHSSKVVLKAIETALKKGVK